MGKSYSLTEDKAKDMIVKKGINSVRAIIITIPPRNGAVPTAMISASKQLSADVVEGLVIIQIIEDFENKSGNNPGVKA